MNHYIRSLALASAAITLVPGIAAAEVDVYGKLMLGLENVDDESAGGDAWEVASHASRFGVKGDAQTDFEGLKAIYQLEWEIDVSDNTDSSEDHIKARNQYVGLKGGFGEVILGRYDTPFKKAQGRIELFDDFEPDIKVLMEGGENREDDIFQYTSPKIADAVRIRLMGIPGEDPAPDGDNGVADATSVSVEFENDFLFLAIAADSDVDGTDVDANRVVAQWKGGALGIGGLIQSTDFGSGDDEEVSIVSARYEIGRAMLKVQAGNTDNYAGIAGNDADLTAFGVDYSLGEKTLVGFLVSGRKGGDDLAAGQSRDVFGLNLIHKF